MAIYDNNTKATTPTQRQPRTDYKALIHNGRKFETLDQMIDFVARERAHVAFKSTKIIVANLKCKKTDEQIAQAMIDANAQMIRDYLDNRDDSRSLFGLE
jgi:hypothetical protein